MVVQCGELGSFAMDIHLIDDDESMCTLWVEMIETLKYQAQSFSSPGAYLEYMGSSDFLPPKLGILSDVNMPFMSGYEFMAAVRKVYPHLRFVILTGSPDVPTQDEFACFYLTKPISLLKLKKVLQGLSMCNENGAHPGVIGCESIDDRCEFCVDAWKCPRDGS